MHAIIHGFDGGVQLHKCNNLRHISHTGALRGLFLPRWTGALVFYRYCRYCVFDFGLQDFSGHPQHSPDMDGASQLDFRIYGSESQASSPRLRPLCIRSNHIPSQPVKICQDLSRIALRQPQVDNPGGQAICMKHHEATF